MSDDVTHFPVDVNDEGEGPELDPAKVVRTLCAECTDTPWPCQTAYDALLSEVHELRRRTRRPASLDERKDRLRTEDRDLFVYIRLREEARALETEGNRHQGPLADRLYATARAAERVAEQMLADSERT